MPQLPALIKAAERKIMADGAVTADPNILIPQFKPDRVLNQGLYPSSVNGYWPLLIPT